MSAAADDGGIGLAFLTVAALLVGVSIMDTSMVLLGGEARDGWASGPSGSWETSWLSRSRRSGSG